MSEVAHGHEAPHGSESVTGKLWQAIVNIKDSVFLAIKKVYTGLKELIFGKKDDGHAHTEHAPAADHGHAAPAPAH